jgi:hypothetical protein
LLRHYCIYKLSKGDIVFAIDLKVVEKLILFLFGDTQLQSTNIAEKFGAGLSVGVLRVAEVENALGNEACVRGKDLFAVL